jgi:hypothetical protein
MTESRVAAAGRITARIATILVVAVAVAVKISIDKALAELAEAQRELR